MFKYPDNEEQIYVKRIIGLPGETVQIVNGVVYVTKTDGKTIQLDDSFVTACEPYGDFGPYVVPPDSYFMLGDNRNDSKDSRFWTNTYVKRDKIIGKVKFRYYLNFTDSIKSYFKFGDFAIAVMASGTYVLENNQ